MPFRTIVFDLDGTLIDSAADVGAAVDRVLVDSGLAPLDPAMYPALMGEGGRVRTRKAFALRGVELSRDELSAKVDAFIAHYAASPVASTRPYPGVADTLAGLAAAGIRLCVCTNKYEASARDVLARLGLMPPIEDAAGADSFGVRKPHPGHILRLLERMNADPASAIMVGDSIHDVEAAKAAGLPVIAVSWGYTATPPDQLGADAVLDRFDRLPDIVRAVAAGRS